MNPWLPRKGFFLTPLIVVANLLMFLVLVVSNASFTQFSVQSGIFWGANYGPLVLDGQWWRLLSSVFLHWSLMHLVFNAAALIFLGRILEPLLGTAVFFISYLVMGVLASIVSVLFNDNVVSAGASGAVFGLFGVFLALLLSNLVEKRMRAIWLKTILAMLAINLATGFFLPVDNAAHVGGLFSGIMLGALLIPLIRKRMINAASRSNF